MQATLDDFIASSNAFMASSTTRLIGLFSILKLHRFTVVDRDRNMTARIMNATSNLSTYQFQDILTDAGVLPGNFPRTRDQFNALNGKCPLCLILCMHCNPCWQMHKSWLCWRPTVLQLAGTLMLGAVAWGHTSASKLPEIQTTLWSTADLCLWISLVCQACNLPSIS